MFKYKEFIINESLAYYIKKIWILDNLSNPLPENNRTIVPNGCFNIAFIAGQGAIVYIDQKPLRLNQGIYFCGQATQSVIVDILPATKVNMVQLFPWAISMFTNYDMRLCKRKIIPLKNINEEFENGASLLNTFDENQILAYLHNQFTDFLFKNEHTLLLYKACISIINSHGGVSIKKLSEQLGCSTRYLQKLFLQYVGLTPKEFSIIIKLRNAIDLLAYPSSKANSSLTQLAMDSNFYDQAHFINTFKTIVRTLPGKFIPSEFLLANKKKN